MDATIKLITLGDSEVGKSSLLLRFCDNSFSLHRVKTLGIDSKTRALQVGDRIYRVQVWDTAGQEKFHTLSQNFYRRADGILLVYDVTQPATLANVHSWMAQIRERCTAPVVLVGNKTDLRSESSEGEQVAHTFGCRFFLTSACSGLNVDAAFQCLTEEVLQSKPKLKRSGTQLAWKQGSNKGCCSHK
jgi:small GTP-binding protein